jgi:hypothetical protein
VCGHKLEDVPVETSAPETGSLLDRVQDTPSQPEVEEDKTPEPEVEEPTVVEEVEEVEEPSTPMEAAVIEETKPEEVPEEPSPEEVPSEEVPEETVFLEVSEDQEAALEKVAEEEPEELPQVKTFKFGGKSLEREEAVPAEEESKDEYVEDAPETASESVAETVPPVTPEVDPVEKIKKAKELLDLGAITEEEFEEIKKKYLALI